MVILSNWMARVESCGASHARTAMISEALQRTDFSRIRYGQCWEDADILIEALEPGPGKRCLSIASAGDNTLALLARSPDYVHAIDLNPAQTACLELRVAAFRELQHHELLALIGSMPCDDRPRLYRQCRGRLSAGIKRFWDDHTKLIEAGIGGAGKFESYFRIFRECVLPLVHSRRRIAELLEPKSHEKRMEFYEREWNTPRWRTLFSVFFSRRVMGVLGRDPDFFRYVAGNVSERLLARTRYALTELDPATNPYLHWILAGHHNGALPFALREENFESIRRNLDRLEWRLAALEDVSASDGPFDCFNLSDVFEYMSEQNYAQLLQKLAGLSRPGARLAYWNMLAPRRRPQELAVSIHELSDLSVRLFARDKAFFYSAFVVEQVR
jgi:S-adenosylmethionine-diacylglycerol 3-amino-3-carboxypropyl transferase